MTKQLAFFSDPPEPQTHAQRCKKFWDYEAFEAKFKPKKTTDDCYTPPAVYTAVLDWIRARVDLEGRPILRPFFPGGDYEHAEYPPGCVVIDNPPFSILRRILTFYVSRKIDFFLFGPGTTLLQRGLDGITYIIQRAPIRYENGADVPTGFITTLFPGRRLILAGKLTDAIEVAQKSQKGASLPIIDLPSEVVTAARLRACVTPGEDLEISCDEAGPILDTFGGRKLFGGGMMVSPMVAERLRAERLRMEAARRVALTPERRRDQLRELAEIDDIF